jgi:ferredoxin-fold anticodon binding domain-containing protein
VTGWEEFVGKKVIVDTDSNFVYVGTLKEITVDFVILEEADVHDRREGPSTKEQYLISLKKYGITPSRKRVSVRKQLVVSLSLLEDVLEY